MHSVAAASPVAATYFAVALPKIDIRLPVTESEAYCAVEAPLQLAGVE